MARLERIVAKKAFVLTCDDSGTISATRRTGGKKSRYDLFYEAAGFGTGPRLGRMIASIIILPKLRKPPTRRSPKRRGTKRSR
jgi:hypothetical protein